MLPDSTILLIDMTVNPSARVVKVAKTVTFNRCITVKTHSGPKNIDGNHNKAETSNYVFQDKNAYANSF